MLKRAGLALRRHFEYLISGTNSSFSPLRLSVFHNRSSISVRCFPSAAQVRRPDTPRSSPAGIQKAGTSSSMTGKEDIPTSKDGKYSFHDRPPLPVELLSAIISRVDNKKSLLNEIRASQVLTEHLLDNVKTRELAEAMSSTPAFRRAVQVLQLAHALGCKLRQNAYECTTHRLATSHHWNAVLSVVSLGKRQTGKTSVRLLNWRIRALVEMDRHATLRDVLEEFQAFHVKPNRRTFHLLISGRVRNRDLAGTRQLLRMMSQIGIPPDDDTHVIIASYYRTFGPNAQVQDRALRSVSVLGDGSVVSTLNRLLQLRLDAHDITGALRILNLFENSQVASIIHVLSGVISTPEDGDAVAYSPLPVSLTNPVTPNAETFSTFIHYMASRRDLAGALAILNGLITSGVRPTAETVTSLIHAFCTTGDQRTAVRLVAEMYDPQMSTHRLFESLAPDYTSVSAPLTTSGISPTTRVLNALLKGLLPVQDVDCVPKILSIMDSNGIQPNASTVEILIAHVAKIKHARPNVLLRLFNKLCSPSIQPTLRHLHVILSSVIRHERYLTFGAGWDSIAVHFSRRRQARPRGSSDNIIPDHGNNGSFDPIAGISLQVPHHHLIQPAVDNLKERRVNVDGAVTALRIKREAGLKLDMDAAQDIFQMLLDRGIQPTEYHFSALMEGYARSGDLQAASDVLKSAVHVGVEPNVIMYTILIAGYARQGNPEQAVRIFQRMVQANIRPDIAAIDALASAFFAVGAYSMARRSLISLWPYVEPFPENLRSVSLQKLAIHFRQVQYNQRGAHPLSRAEWSTLYRKLWRLRKIWEIFNSRKNTVLHSTTQGNG